MAAQYHSLFTTQGLALLREAIQNGTKLGITHMAYGDGNGIVPTPNADFAKLVKEVYRTPLNRLAPSKDNPNWLEADGVIPSAIGGFNIREVGLYAGNVLVAYANYPSTYKPSADQGTAQIKTIRIVLQIDNTANFELKIDASVVMATIQSVNDVKLELYQNTIGQVATELELERLEVWGDRTVYVKDAGYFTYSIATAAWIPIDNFVFITESIADLVDLNSWPGRTVLVKSYYEGLSQGGGEFVAMQDSNLSANGVTIFSSKKPNIFWVRTNFKEITPTMAGAVGNGIFDDTDGIQKCINMFRSINMKDKEWYVTKKITVPSYRFIDLYGSNLKANNGTDPIFEFVQAGEGLTISHGGGVITGIAGSFLKCSGSTNQPTTVGQSARQIRLEGLYIVSETIKWFCDWQDAVRQVFFNKCHVYTANGINANGKCVEIEGHGCIFYGSTQDTTTSGFKLRAPGNGRWYSEGFHFTDCTIDNYGITFDVNDIYAMSITAGFVGSLPLEGCLVAKFGQPTSTHCKNIKFTGVNIYGRIEFEPNGGNDYHAQFTGCVSEGFEGVAILLKNNASSISIADHHFHSSKKEGVAVVGVDNNNNISVSNISCDSSMVGGVQFKGSNGNNCSVDGITYDGTKDPFYTERAVLVSNIPVATSLTVGYLQKFNKEDLNGSRAVGDTIASVSGWFAKGEPGNIICEIGFKNADAATQRFDITIPDGMVIPNGLDWNSKYIFTNAASGRLSVRIPYTITKNLTNQEVKITNAVGNTVNIPYHGIFGFKRDW